MSFALYLLCGTVVMIQLGPSRSAYTNVRWEAFLGAYLLALAGVAAAGLLSERRSAPTLGALTGAATALGGLFIFSVGMVVLALAVPLWVATARTAREPREQAQALASGALAAVIPFMGLLTLYHG